MKQAYALRLFLTTNPVFAFKKAIPSHIQHIVVIWVYALLLLRTSFFILYHTF